MHQSKASGGQQIEERCHCSTKWHSYYQCLYISSFSFFLLNSTKLVGNMASILQCCPFLTRDPSLFLRKVGPLLVNSAQRCPVMMARTFYSSVTDLQSEKDTCGNTGEMMGWSSEKRYWKGNRN